MKPITFLAMVTLDENATLDIGGASATWQMGVRLPGDAGPPLEALVTTEDGQPLRPGDSAREVTVTVSDDMGLDDLMTGAEFELRKPGPIGKGVIVRRVYI